MQQHVLLTYLHHRAVATATAVGVLRGHTHAWAKGNWWRWCRAVRSTGWARVVLRATPAETDARVTDGVALHLVDGHLGCVALNELDETAALAWGNLDVCDLAKALEEGAKLVLGDVAGETADEDGGVVGVSELVHGLGSTVVAAHRGSAHRVHAHTRAAAALGHAAHCAGTSGTTALVLGCGGGDAHGAIAAVDALHLGEGLLLVLLASEPDKTVAARHTANGVGHDLGGLGGLVLVLEELYEDELGDLGAQVSDENAEFGTTLIAAVRIISDHCRMWIAG